jgi:hypothetical protein
MTIYTSKKTGASYTLTNKEIEVSLSGDSKVIYTLTSTEDPTDVIRTTESVLKRWYKKSVEVDFSTAEEKPIEEEAPAEESKPEKTHKAKKAHKPKAKTYEEQTWGLGHTRMRKDTFCGMFELSSVEYDALSSTILIKRGSDTIARRRAWQNEITGSVWFRFSNYEYELTDVAYQA